MFHKVIIVEDEDLIRQGLKFGVNWHALNCTVIADTHSSEEAISLIKELKPDIVLMDINLPIKNGLEVLELTKDLVDYSAIIISGYSEFGYAQKAIGLGVVSYLTKPIDQIELEDAINLAILKQEKKKFLVDSINEQNIVFPKNNMELKYKKSIDDDLVTEILEFIEENYHDRIQLKDLVEHVNYSESTINNRLKSTIGTTFNQTLNEFRIHKAVEEIEADHSINLENLSYEVGIPNYKHFSDVFKKYTSFTPKEYAVFMKEIQ